MGLGAGQQPCEKRRCAVSVDLDEIGCYYSIHGLPHPEGAPRSVYDIALGRISDWAAEAGIPLSLFVVGRDFELPENKRKLTLMYEAGAELANHTLDHLYDLSRQPRESMRYQIEVGAARVREIVGPGELGFRAPGYVVTDELLSVVAESGALYDSSVFPCPLYYAAKGLAIGVKGLRGKASRSLVDSPRVLLAPTRPYRMGSPYWEQGNGLWELPIQVTPVLRMPFIGTSLTLAGTTGARLLTRSIVGEPFVNLELHGLDFLDHTDGLAGLSLYQPDLRIPTRTKLNALSAAVSELKKAGYGFVRLRDAVTGKS